MALAPRTVQNIPERFKRAPMTVLQPASGAFPPAQETGGSVPEQSHRRRPNLGAAELIGRETLALFSLRVNGL